MTQARRVKNGLASLRVGGSDPHSRGPGGNADGSRRAFNSIITRPRVLVSTASRSVTRVLPVAPGGILHSLWRKRRELGNPGSFRWLDCASRMRRAPNRYSGEGARWRDLFSKERRDSVGHARRELLRGGEAVNTRSAPYPEARFEGLRMEVYGNGASLRGPENTPPISGTPSNRSFTALNSGLPM